jgi:hypothetical protein
MAVSASVLRGRVGIFRPWRSSWNGRSKKLFFIGMKGSFKLSLQAKAPDAREALARTQVAPTVAARARRIAVGTEFA